MPALDVEYRQVLVYFPDDANGLFWHHRILIVPLGGGRWTWITPDLDVQSADLTQHRVIALSRGQAFPARRRAECYGFDPIDPAELEPLVREARELAIVMGADPADVNQSQPAAVKVWRIADLSHQAFGEEVPAGVEGVEDLWEARGRTALVKIDDAWTFAVESADGESKDDFMRKFRVGAGRDPRLAGDRESDDGRRYVSFNDLFGLLGEHKWKAWPIQGPRAVKEFMAVLRAAGYESFQAYHADWIKRSGVGSQAGVAREHGFLCELLRLGGQWDQVDVSSLSSFELIVRRIHQIELAVKKNPKMPDFDGLEELVETAIDSSGGAAIESVDTWLAEKQKVKAFALKQRRLLKEEVGGSPSNPKNTPPKAGKKQGGDDG